MIKDRTSRPKRSLRKWARIAVAGGAAAIGLGTIAVSGASAGHSTLEATIGCEETTWTLNFDGSFFAAPFINLVRVRLLDGPAEALAQVPADGHWDMMSTPVPNPPDFDHAVAGNIHFSLTFPQTLDTVTLTFQIHFVDLHIGVPGPPIEHPDTEEVRTITRTHNCTPTATTTSTTTTLPGEPAAVSAVTPLCISDAPFIDVTFGPQTRYIGKTAFITFIDLDGNTVGTHQAPYEPNGVVRLVYPGASVDAAGNATDWPGWKLAPNGNWIPDPSDTHLRDGLTVRIEVNPTAEAKVAYPPATSGCANPDIPPPPPCNETTTTGAGSATTTPTPPTCETTTPPSSRTLPPTGSNMPTAVMAGGLVSLGIGVLAVTTTRRRAQQT